MNIKTMTDKKLLKIYTECFGIIIHKAGWGLRNKLKQEILYRMKENENSKASQETITEET